ncbi:MAG: polyprenyl synthetase family protein [Proteobacteria bacterium]|nr:polyprenyl synthetase family protein [Pseudomonadota bacterium]
MDIVKYLKEKKALVEAAMAGMAPGGKGLTDRLHQAMNYSLEAGGKRIRPILTIAACEALGGDINKVMPAACALEFIHTYSLIHDDLPAMDDDDYRRGEPTCHRAFDEATAILAGDGLLTAAFELLTRSDLFEGVDPATAMEVANDIARAAGHGGMVGGQQADMDAEGKEVDLPTLEFIHTHKTGALILASIKAGAKLGGGSPKKIKALIKYGEAAGLAFQVADDILDVTGDTTTLGKDAGSDEARGKATYPAILGVREAKNRAAELLDTALDSLNTFDSKADPLREIARYIVNRTH